MPIPGVTRIVFPIQLNHFDNYGGAAIEQAQNKLDLLKLAIFGLKASGSCITESEVTALGMLCHEISYILQQSELTQEV